MRIIFMATSEWALPSLEKIYKEGYKIDCIFTQPDRKQGRNRKRVLSPIKNWAFEKEIIVNTPNSINSPESKLFLSKINPDLILVCGYGQILKPSILNLPKLGCYNLHFSKLPRWRGASPVQSAIIAGDNYTGVSFQKMVNELDAGPIISESSNIEILSNDTTKSLGRRLSMIGAELLVASLEKLFKNNYSEKFQNKKYITISKKIKKNDGKISWENDTAENIERKLRAFNPWPGIFFFNKEGKRVQITDAEVIESNLKPGFIDRQFIVGTLKDGLKITKVIEEGKKEVDSKSYINGHIKLIGTKLK